MRIKSLSPTMPSVSPISGSNKRQRSTDRTAIALTKRRTGSGVARTRSPLQRGIVIRPPTDIHIPAASRGFLIRRIVVHRGGLGGPFRYPLQGAGGRLPARGPALPQSPRRPRYSGACQAPFFSAWPRALPAVLPFPTHPCHPRQAPPVRPVAMHRPGMCPIAIRRRNGHRVPPHPADDDVSVLREEVGHAADIRGRQSCLWRSRVPGAAMGSVSACICADHAGGG